MKLFPISVILASIMLFSCKKDSTSNNQKTIAKDMLTVNLVTDTLFVNKSAPPSEFGYKFFFSKNGTVTQLGCLYPTKGNFRVSLWNFSTKDLISAAQVNITDTTKFTYVSIPQIEVTANVRYVLSINNTKNGQATAFYAAIKKPQLQLYPFTIGDATVEALLVKESAISVFPDVVGANSVFAGIPDLVFETK